MPTKRTAYAAVRNNTGRPIVAVGVAHKYSDNYKHEGNWPIIKPGELSNTMTVEYNTGFLTTGKDWWVVTFYTPDMHTMYYSDPTNFRGLLDFFDNILPDTIAAVVGTATAVSTSWTGPGAVAAAAAAAAVSKATTSALVNSEGTSGYKQHILTAEDEWTTTEIVINADYTITFKSKSGDSNTVSSTKVVPQPPRAKL